MIREAELRKRDSELNCVLPDKDEHEEIYASVTVPGLAPWAKKINGTTMPSDDGEKFTWHCSLLIGVTVMDGKTEAFDLCFGNTLHFDESRHTGIFVGTLYNDFRAKCVVFDSKSGALELCSPAAIELVESSVEEVDPDGLKQAWDLHFGQSGQISQKKPNLRPRPKRGSPSSPNSDDNSDSSKSTVTNKPRSTKRKSPGHAKKNKPPKKALIKCYCSRCDGRKEFTTKKTINAHVKKDLEDAARHNEVCAPTPTSLDGL